jgi:PAS domain S-box-containing protein
MSNGMMSSEPVFVAPAPQFPAHNQNRHSVQFYKENSALLSELARFIGSALVAGDAAVVVATQAHRDGIAELLGARGLDVATSSKQGRYVALDAAEALSKFMVNDSPDARTFHDLFGDILLRAKSAARNDQPSPAVFGEMVALLWADGKAEAAVQLEQLWNDLAKSHSFSLCCAYPMSGFCREENGEPFARICAAHSLVIPSDSYTALESDEQRMRTVASLQQKAEVLEAEVALRQSEERFRLLVSAVRDYAIFMLDPEGRISSWNSGAQRIKGYAATEIIGKHFSCFYTPEELQTGKPQRELETAARVGHVEDEGWRVRKDGSKFWASVVITAMRDESGKLIGFSKVTRDFTERMLVLKALRESQRELHESEDSLRRLSLHLLRTQDEERRRIGRDLHDSLGQSLSVLKMKLDSLAGSNGSRTDAMKNENISECANLTEECIKEVRTIAYLLYPPMLEEMGLKSAISWYLDGFTKRSGIQTTFDISADFGRLPQDVETAIFRILQEGLTNVHRHSGSETAHVLLTAKWGTVRLEISDKGKGMPIEYSQESGSGELRALGVGLRAMSERMRQLGGKLELISTSRGTTVIASVPVEMSSAVAANSAR